MSFERKNEGNRIRITTNRDFMLSEDIHVMNVNEAMCILSSKKIMKITSAENKDGEIHVTRHFCTCPLCGKRFSAYVNRNLTKNPYLSKNIADLCDNQLSLFPEVKVRNILFNQPMKIGDTVKCTHCKYENFVSNEMTNCLITINQNRLGITHDIQSFSEINDMGWLPEKMLFFDDTLCSEIITFDLQSGRVTVSLNCGRETLCTIPVISSNTLGKNDPWLRMFANKRIFREIKRSFENTYGVIPFSDKMLTFDNLILLTKFVGYPTDFYRDLPLSIDDKKVLLPEEFESISIRLHYSDSVPSVFFEMNLPKVKSLKRIIFNRPSILMYEKELERLWKIIDNTDLFCMLLSCKSVFAVLAYFHLYTGIDAYLIEMRRIKGAVWLEKILTSNYSYYLCRLGVEFLSSNPTIRQNLLKKDVRGIRYRYYHNDGQFYFSVPMPICMVNNSISVEAGFQFIFLDTLKDYYIAGKELNNCLDTYAPNNDSQVYTIRKSNKLLTAIEISDNHIIQAFCRNNAPISSKPLINAITAWAEHNSYSIDDDFFDV